MDFHGDINLQHNKLKKSVFQQESRFPDSPIVGRVLFKNQKLYMCVAINANSTPIWVPLTNKIDTYIHTQVATQTTWNVVHKLHTTIPIVQIYDTSGSMLIPDNVEIINNDEIRITLSGQIGGTAVIMFSNIMPESGIGIL